MSLPSRHSLDTPNYAVESYDDFKHLPSPERPWVANRLGREVIARVGAHGSTVHRVSRNHEHPGLAKGQTHRTITHGLDDVWSARNARPLYEEASGMPSSIELATAPEPKADDDVNMMQAPKQPTKLSDIDEKFVASLKYRIDQQPR